MAIDHFRFVHSFRNKRRFSNFSSEQFSRGHSENHCDPEGSIGDPTYSRRNTGFDLQERDRSDKRFSEFVFVPDLCDPQEIGGSACHPESQRVQSLHFNPTLQDGDSERYSSTAISKRLGCVDRFERCLPPHSGSSAIQEVLGFPIHGHDLSVQGSAFRPQRLTLGLYKSSSYSCGPSPPSRNSSLLLSGRLAPSGGVQGALGASSSDDPAMDPGSRFPCELEEVFPGTAETSCLSRGAAGHPNLLARPLEHRVLALQSVIRDLTSGWLYSALLWQKFLGHLASFVDLVPNCRMLMRPLQLHFLRYFTPLTDPQDKLVPLSPEVKVLCRAWASPSRLLEGKPFAPPPHRLVISTDASGQGWGAVLHPHRVSGVWSKAEASDHINSLELKAVLLALQNLESHVVGQSVLIRSDNMTVVSFINYQGGTHSSSLCRLALDLWEWCHQRKIFLQAAHIPGEDNIVADFLSRGKYLPSEWVLKRSVFRKISLASSPPPEVLLSVPGRSCLEDRRAVVSVDESSSVRVSSFLSSPQDLGQDCSGQSGPSPGCPVLASETLVSSSPSSLGRSSKGVASSKGPSGTTPVSDSSSQSRKSSSISMASLRQQGEEAGLSQELRSSQLKHSGNPLATLMIPDWRVSGSGVPRSLAIPLLPL